jgi:2,3-diketo-5-methylthio-1-phosphopentane phosphatase
MAAGYAKKRHYVAFFDFDNTITTYDILDDIIGRFSKDMRWMGLERKWLAGRIGSRECLDGQIRGVRISRKDLDRYLAKIRIDPSFKKILRLCDAKKIKYFILSDNFGYILKRILKANGVRGIRVYCNRLKFRGGALVPEFPFLNTECHKCAHCKKGNLISRAGRGAMTIYVGDGLSDICPAERADIVFAKGRLEKYFRKKRLEHVPFKRLGEVYDHLERSVL